MKKVLVLEDEASIRSFIVINLQRAGYEVVEAECGEEALQKLQENPDTKLCLLDIMLPDIDGFEVCRRIRMSNAQVGIIMLTARTQEMDKVTGLMTGADDYVTKPFSPAELTARIDALYRRIGGDSSLNVSVGDDEDGHEKIDMIVDRRENIEAKISARQEQAYKARILAQCMKKLDEREQYIIKNRMLTENPSTLDDIGTHFNISRERVRQIEKKAFDKLSSEVKKAMAA